MGHRPLRGALTRADRDSHLEGNDHLIVRALLAKVMDLDEAALEVDRVDHSGMGWQAVLDLARKALLRFYGKCCAMAVLGVDNDGNTSPLVDGRPEDPDHPRHWRHSPTRNDLCRQCDLEALVERSRADLGWISNKPGATWPILVCVPVEMIESWLLIALALTMPGKGSLQAENEPRARQKAALYGRPDATREDVENIALPLLRSLTAESVGQLRKHSRSFDDFATQSLSIRNRAELAAACWT